MYYLVSGTAQWSIRVEAESEDKAEDEAYLVFPDVDFDDEQVDSVEEADY